MSEHESSPQEEAAAAPALLPPSAVATAPALTAPVAGDATPGLALPAGTQLPGFRCGLVAIIGKPNAGKSTLMNAIVGQKLAIVSDKPQTTREAISGIFTTARFQIVFVDTPGVIVPEDRFNEAIVGRAADALREVDVVVHLMDARDRDAANPRLMDLLRRVPRATTKLLVLNKIDTLRGGVPPGGPKLPEGISPSQYADMLLISARKQQGLDLLINRIVAALPEGPLLYDADQVTEKDERFFVAEIVREKIFRRTGAEVPYSVHTFVDEFIERPDGKDFIRVVINVERDGQKAIILGPKGEIMKEIGMAARKSIEALTGRPCYLELHIKIRKDWRKKEFDLNRFGFKKPKARGKS